MKNIKKLKSTAIGGLTVRNYKTFPSMEWGEDGGLEADIYLGNTLVVSVFQEGNGGCASCSTHDEALLPKLQEYVLKFLDKNDKNFRSYSWNKNKTANEINADDYESFVSIMHERHDIISFAEREAKKGHAGVATYIDTSRGYLETCSYNTNVLTTKEMVEEAWGKTNITIYTLEELKQEF